MSSRLSSSSPPLINKGLVNFHFEKRHHKVSNEEAAIDVMREETRQEHDPATFFSDWSFYQDLKRQPGCTNVELSQLHVEHSSWFLVGIQATYRSSFSDERKDVETEAPLHEFQRFRYRQYGQSTRSTLSLQEDEYITNLAIRRVDKISDRISIKTNQREVSFGSPAFASFRNQWLLPVANPAKEDENDETSFFKVVALAGTITMMSEQVGCYSESQNWKKVGPWILMRQLVENKRAAPLLLDSHAHHGNKSDLWIRSLLLEMNDDTFKNVLTFLIPP